ncbi:flagellar hook-basal body complex protein FliE [Neptuniibacter sp. CAU 1671]|uniref:flagellar hook-basal body complex protein FliE n=1 Tax=Neptuniibacter sp. CAU 1671 TaxID=3032593 RepID=UPI0023DADB54|nr:flagellar hook-basal body complex protein FliE [Neptuniibacter sp. CAU 1671]MDF2181348.1 flagellar hook-basal body complex protein FliE [Neptuniibacter sp. CAU 1671]
MVDRADINSVLAQMRAIQSQVQASSSTPSHVIPQNAGPQSVERTEFGSILKNVVDQVNDAQKTAKNLAEAFERGDPMVDLPQVMLSAEKASVSFQAMTQVRNRLVTAYEDIMKMSI